jgi:hypothetical protein
VDIYINIANKYFEFFKNEVMTEKWWTFQQHWSRRNGRHFSNVGVREMVESEKWCQKNIYVYNYTCTASGPKRVLTQFIFTLISFLLIRINSHCITFSSLPFKNECSVNYYPIIHQFYCNHSHDYVPPFIRLLATLESEKWWTF